MFQGLEDALKEGMMFAPDGALTDPSSAANENVKPVIKSGHRIYHYYDAANWDATGATPFSPEESSEGGTVFILSSHNAGTDDSKYMYAKSLDTARLWEAIHEALGVVTLPAYNSDTAGEDFMYLIDKLDDFILAATTIYIQNNDAWPAMDKEDFGRKIRDRSANAVEYHKLSPDYTKLKLFEAMAADGVGQDSIDVAMSRARIYYAFRLLDNIWPEKEQFFFLGRLVMLTKIMYVANLLKLAHEGIANDKKPALLHQFYNLMFWIYVNDIQGFVRSDLDSENGLDDMFQRNVVKGQQIRAESEKLIDKKDMVQSIQNNLKSIENSDRLAKRRRRNMLIMFAVSGVLGASLLISLGYFYTTGNTSMTYLVAGIVSIILLGFEAFQGLSKLLDA